jgi:hypothetical protein
MEKNSKLETSVCFFSWKEKGVVHVHFKANVYITPDEQDEMFAAHQKFAGDAPHCVIYTADEFVNFSPEARKRSRDLEMGLSYLASASVSSNIAYTLLANFYIRFNKPQKPFKNFMKEPEALEWLRTFLDT